MIVRAVFAAEPRVFAGDSLTLAVGPILPGGRDEPQCDDAADPAFGYAVTVTPTFPDGIHRSAALAPAWAAYIADQKGWTLDADAALVRYATGKASASGVSEKDFITVAWERLAPGDADVARLMMLDAWRDTSAEGAAQWRKLHVRFELIQKFNALMVRAFVCHTARRCTLCV